MRNARKFRFIALLCVLSMVLAACAPAATQAPVDQAEPTAAEAAPAEEPTATTASAQPAEEATEPPAAEAGDAQDWRSLDAYSRYPEEVTFSIGKAIASEIKLPAGDDTLNNKATAYIKEVLNVNITHLWEVPSTNFAEKQNLAITSGDIPDAMIVDDIQLQQLVEADAVEDLTPYIPQYLSPTLQSYYNSTNNEAFNGVTFSGKIMALPGLNVGADAVNWLWVRKDWLDKLGLPVPQTMDDIIAVAQAFKEGDPDGNGVADTIPLTGSGKDGGIVVIGNNLHGFKSVFNSYQAFPRQWIEGADGKVVYGSTTPEMKVALQTLADMYQQGLIDPEFATQNNDQANELIVSGKAGMMFGPWWIPWSPLADSIKNDPNADWIPVRAPLAADGKFYSGRTPYSSSYLVVRKGYEHPEAILKVMNLQTAMMRRLNDTPTLYENIDQVWGAVMPFGMTLDYPNGVEIRTTRLKESLEGNVPADFTPEELNEMEICQAEHANPKQDLNNWATCFARLDASQMMLLDIEGVRSVVQAARIVPGEMAWANLTKLEDEIMLQIITGQKPVDAFDQFVTDWNAQGGADITAQVQAAVDANK